VSKYSSCCGEKDRAISIYGPDYSDVELCPQCKDHCTFEEGETLCVYCQEYDMRRALGAKE